jgi:hypothetical protein
VAGYQPHVRRLTSRTEFGAATRIAGLLTPIG